MRGRGDRRQSARVHDEPPARETFVPPERDARSGRPTTGDRSNKHRSTEQPATDVPVASPPRRMPRRIPRWVPAAVAAAVVAAGVAGVAAISSGGDDNNNDSASPNTGAAAGAPIAAVTTTATTDTTAPTATTLTATTTPVTAVQATTTEQPTTTTTITTLPPTTTTTTTIPAGLNPKRITGYRTTSTYTRAENAEELGVIVGKTVRNRVECSDEVCTLGALTFKAGARSIRRTTQYSLFPGSDSPCDPITVVFTAQRDGQGRYRGTSTADPVHVTFSGGGKFCSSYATTSEIRLVPITQK